MKEEKPNKLKASKSIYGKKSKLEDEQLLHCDNGSIKNISIKIPIFEINNDCVQNQDAIDGHFDNLQTREEIVESKCSQIDPNAIVDDKPELDVKPKIRWSKYKKLYKSHWELDPNLKEWIQPIVGDPQKVLCRCCGCSIRAHKADLYKHSGTNKHKRNFTPLQNENDNNKGIIFSMTPKRNKKKRYKTEKVATPDGSSYIILQTEQNTPAYHSEPETESIFMDYADAISGGGVKVDSLSHSNSDEEISNIANKIGIVLVEEIEKILRSQKNVLKYFREGRDISLTDSNIRKLTKICIGHLSQKYLIESAMEPTTFRSPTLCKENKELSSKFRAIEEKLEKTVAEMKDLKMTFNGVSQGLPFTQIDYGEIFSGTSSD